MMTIVLNEEEWAKDAIRRKMLGKRPFETMCRVAKYYIDQGNTKAKTRDMLDAFLLECCPGASLPKWSDTLDYAIAAALKQEFLRCSDIPVSDGELTRIRSLHGAQAQRLAFALLCVAKYRMLVNPKSDGWVNEKDSDLMRLANISTSIKRQCSLYRELREAGLIRFSRKVDNTSVQVLFIDGTDAAMRVSDFRNLGYQYMMHFGDPRYTACHRCGMVFRNAGVMQDGRPRRGRRPSLCPVCSQRSGGCTGADARDAG